MKDPIFSKRYKLFIFGQACGNKAPRFDRSDSHIPKFVPKFTLEKKKIEMVQKNTKKREDKKVKQENELLKEKTKSLMNSIESLMG